jgi:hypothetical protein
MPQLKMLDQSHSAVTGAGLAGVESLPHLERLSLEGTRVSDAALLRLAKAPTLEQLTTSSPSWPNASLEFHPALPMAAILSKGE